MVVAMNRSGFPNLGLFIGAFVGSTATRDYGEVVTHVEQSAYGVERTTTFQQK